jgi:hypothetical protein
VFTAYSQILLSMLIEAMQIMLGLVNAITHGLELLQVLEAVILCEWQLFELGDAEGLCKPMF